MTDLFRDVRWETVHGGCYTDYDTKLVTYWLEVLDADQWIGTSWKQTANELTHPELFTFHMDAVVYALDQRLTPNG